MPNMVLKNIKNPMEVKELIHAQVEDTNIRRRVRFGEIMSADVDHDDEYSDYE